MAYKEYGIKYKIIPFDEMQYILIPVGLVEGKTDFTEFKTKNTSYSMLCGNDWLEKRYVVDKVFDLEDIKFYYDYEEDDFDFLKEYFYEDHKDIIIHIDLENETNSEINLRIYNSKNKDILYCMDRGNPAIVLNDRVLEEILECDDLEKMKLILNKYKRSIEVYQDFNDKSKLTKVRVVNGKIDSIETARKISNTDLNSFCKEILVPKDKKVKDSQKSDFSYNGLRKYIKERIFGHDQEIDTIAKILYMNHTAEKGEPIESILLVGPTGTGKTQTVKAACSYLDIPTYEVNAANIVPQGIVGMSIEDIIMGLYEQSLQDLEKAQRGLVFLDEFDKLNSSELEIKSAVKNILLTFTEGGTIMVDNDNYHFSFDSSMTSKVFAGVFDRVNDTVKTVGFTTGKINFEKSDNESFLRQRIIDKNYFSEEELSRITTILKYEDLSRETKREILLKSKLSELIKKKERYKRQFNIDLVASDEYVDAVLDSMSKKETGMRSVNNYIKENFDIVEKFILENENQKYKKLVLTEKTVSNPKVFDLI